MQFLAAISFWKWRMSWHHSWGDMCKIVIQWIPYDLDKQRKSYFNLILMTIEWSLVKWSQEHRNLISWVPQAIKASSKCPGFSAPCFSPTMSHYHSDEETCDRPLTSWFLDFVKIWYYYQWYKKKMNWYFCGASSPYLVECVSLLTHCGLVTPYGDRDLGQHWLM